ncbi:hypothetical protein K435DRAFT_649225 [Dendrothele bispora CBS 962.96]|uniref:DNA damage-binding protein 1 n=1 Tax=Dendrothele bispora (strain CBS 962.96) TaxID=1314807 RepID=A0A4S8MPG8_DENBC|nr:hypothetical protein K435DRAFT_649225 [Dendrothele bispora CBS 962.96]
MSAVGPTRITATFHPSSSVLSSVKCQLLSADLEHLVVAKLNSLEIYSIQPDKLRHECSLEIRGKVRSVKAIPIPNSHRSNILAFLDHPDPELLLLAYSETEPGGGKLELKEQVQLDERGARPAEFFNDVVIHPSAELAVVSCYAGRLKVLNLSPGSHFENYDVQLPEINVLSLAFLPEDQYVLTILHIDHKENIQLISREIKLDDTGAELSYELSLLLPPTTITDKDIPYPTEYLPQLQTFPPDNDNNVLGGVLIVGGRKILLFETCSPDELDKHEKKRKRLGNRKKSKDENEQTAAKEKEEERRTKRRKAKASVGWPWSQLALTSFHRCTPVGSKFFIGDSFGRLALLSMNSSNGETELVLVPLGETSSATTITYLTNQALYVGSHLGDSHVVQISPAPLTHTDKLTLPIDSEIRSVSSGAFASSSDDINMRGGSSKGKGKADDDFEDSEPSEGKGRVIRTHGRYLTNLQSFKNIAPIHDGVLADLDGSGPHQIVTCSGGGNTGSINVVRIGVDFEELASMTGLPNVVGVWPLRGRLWDNTHALVLASTLQETHVFGLNSANTISLLPSNSAHFILDEQTLCAQNIGERVGKEYVDGSMIVQITPKAIRLLEYDSVLDQWSRVDHLDVDSRPEWSGRKIVAASANASQILVALSNGVLASFKIARDKASTTGPKKSPPWYKTEISAVSCTPLNSSKNFTSNVAVAFWHTNRIKILKFSEEGFTFITESPELSAPARSLLFYNFGIDNKPDESDYHAFLLAGLADGTLVTMTWIRNELHSVKVVSLGAGPVCLSADEVQGKRTVLAAGSRSVMVSWEKSGLHYSPVTLKDVVTAQRLNSKHYPSSLLLANPSGLFIGKVKQLDKMHIRSTSLGLDSPRKIAYDPTVKAFGIVCVRTEPSRIGLDQKVTSSFRLLDDTTFTELARFTCDDDEQAMSLTLLKHSDANQTRTFFCVGTVYIRDEEKEPTKGRILVFSLHQSKESSSVYQLNVAINENVSGCVYSLASMSNGTLAAAINSSVMVYRLSVDEMESHSLKRLQIWDHNYLVSSIAEYKNHLVVADQFSSVSLLRMPDETSLNTLARDYSPLWPICVEAFSEKSIIGAEQSLNLFTFSTKTENNRVVLKRDGFYNVGDVVSKFVRGSLVSSDKSGLLRPTHVFFTLSGRIGIIIDVKGRSEIENLTALQTQMVQTAAASEAVGNVSHARHRAPRSSKGRSDADEGAYGILDGDFLENYLRLVENSPDVAEQIIKGAEIPLDRNTIQNTLKVLQGMH